MPRRLYLIRHGETEANRLKVIEGTGESILPEYGSSLNYKGAIQAQMLGHALAEVNVHHVYTSPARRAIETANQICLWTKIDHMPLKKSIITNLIEINFGVLEGLNVKKVKERYPDLYKIYREKPSQTIFPEGESVAQAYNRVSRAIDKIIAAHASNENIIIVSHGGSLALIFIHILKLDLDNMYRAVWHNNCGLSIIEWEKFGSRPKIVCMNDISHLKDEHSQRLKA